MARLRAGRLGHYVSNNQNKKRKTSLFVDSLLMPERMAVWRKLRFTPCNCVNRQTWYVGFIVEWLNQNVAWECQLIRSLDRLSFFRRKNSKIVPEKKKWECQSDIQICVSWRSKKLSRKKVRTVFINFPIYWELGCRQPVYKKQAENRLFSGP